MVVLVVDVVVVAPTAVGQPSGAGASFRRNVLSSLPSLSLITVPPNSVQQRSVLRAVTTATGDIPPCRSTATWDPLQIAFTSTRFFTRTRLHVAPLGSR